MTNVEIRPVVSVVIATFERDDVLAVTLERFAPGQQPGAALLPGPADAIDAPPRQVLRTYEVIVTDAGRRTTAAAMITRRFPWARWTGCPGAGPGANRNNGASQARGEWIAFLDDDCVPESGFLAAILDCAAQTPADVIEGRILVRDLVDSPWRRQPVNPCGGLYWSGNLAIRRDVFHQMGGFDPDYIEGGEDVDFGHRIRTSSVRAVFCPDALVWHPSQPESLAGMIHRTLAYRWRLLFWLKSSGPEAITASTPVAWARLVRGEFMNRVRTSWHFFSRFDRGQWRTRLFGQAWSWLTFPFVLPYFMLWDLRFRRMLRARLLNQPGESTRPRDLTV